MASEAAVKAAKKTCQVLGCDLPDDLVGDIVARRASIIDAAFSPVLAAKDAEIERLNRRMDALTCPCPNMADLDELRSERDALSAKVERLEGELRRLMDVVCEEDVALIDAALAK